ncbi:VOC family protein [Pseudomonas putida]|uniref:VOC family protein n=1 Tax=Pseudomonas putida TaxID=303 RepID=UPI00308255E4
MGSTSWFAQRLWFALVPELTVSDLKQSLRFYGEVLDFKIEFERTRTLGLPRTGGSGPCPAMRCD